MSTMQISQPVPLALVHHANQYLITDVYDNRQGIMELVEGYAAALRLHEHYGVPANLHLSGTLIEAVAWYCPWFLEFVRHLRAKGLIALIGGTYAENVMTPFSAAFNMRQLNEHWWLYERHLGCSAAEINICWIPERVWDTERLAPVLTSSELRNGGYRYVLLDDRLAYPVGQAYANSPRARFDAAGPYSQYTFLDGTYTFRGDGATDGLPLTQSWRVWQIAGSNGLSMIPISANLRYWVPPRNEEQWWRLNKIVAAAATDASGQAMLVYADDLEKTAGVGGWEQAALGHYETFLQWVASRPDIAPVLLPPWLAAHPPQAERTLEAGAFYELAQEWRAGEDYHGWWNNEMWAPYRHYFHNAQTAVEEAAQAGGDQHILDLAWKHLLASTYETAWHDPAPGGRAPAPWAKAVASHVRACHLMAAAARWFARDERAPFAAVMDVDQDDQDEVILANDMLYAVFAPNEGGRLIALFARTEQGGALVIGNPSDDWNFQQELNRYMDWPPNHPGGLADVGAEHDRYEVAVVDQGATFAMVEMIDVQPHSPFHGTTKRVLLAHDRAVLMVGYGFPDGLHGVATETCLSPDYYGLLREGRAGLHLLQGRSWRGVRNGNVVVWIGWANDEAAWTLPARPEAGHGLNVRVKAHAEQMHLVIGCGAVDDAACQSLIDTGRTLIHQHAHLLVPAMNLEVHG